MESLAKLLFNLNERKVMVFIETANGFTQTVQEIAFGLSLLISGIFLMEYKKYTEQQKKKEMLDQFLND